MSEDDRFLSRWSQRKRLAAEEARKAAEVLPAPVEPPVEEVPFDLSLLPDLEALTPETDIRLFLQKGVPDELRNSALRKMWALDPAIRDSVGDALDYAWDWNAPGGVPGGGELGAGFDTAKMVAQIFGDAPTDKNVIDDAASQQEASQSFGASVDLPSEPTPETAGVTENRAASCTSVQVTATLQGSDVALASHKKRRHGSAAPTAPSQSIMS